MNTKDIKRHIYKPMPIYKWIIKFNLILPIYGETCIIISIF